MLKKEAEDPEVIQRRWDKKKEQIEILANNIQKLRYNVTLGLKDSDNEKVFLTALVVAIILETSERVGNEASAKNNHVGITCLRKKQVSIDGNKVTLEYTGKSGVEHVKSFSDEKIAKALKFAIKNSKTDDVFCTSEGFKIKADRINSYLSDFKIRSKDIRGHSANKWMLEKLKNGEVEDNENKRKKFFMQSLRKTAIKVGHGASTLRKHYLIPELETNYIKNGTIINLNERESYELGGEIEKQKEFLLTFYRVSAESDNDSRELCFGNDYDEAKLEYDYANVSDFSSDNGGLVMFQKYTNKYKFVYELDEEFETIEDYPIEDYYNDSDYYKLTEEGEYEDIENRDVKPINKESDDLLVDVENHYKKVYGSYKYNKISVNNEKDEYDDEYKEYGCIQLRIADHSENVKNIDKFGSCDYYISVVIANKNKTANKFLTSMYERRRNEIELSFDSDDSFEYITSEIDEKIKEGKEYILDKNGIETFEKGGTLSNIEFKCDYEKYFEYVPLSEIEKYIEFDREVEHKISKKYLDELTEEIKVNGITYPITLEIYDGKGLIVEGNHRIAVAKRLGIKYIPIRVIERYRPFTGTIYEDKVKELPSSSNVTYAKVMYGVQPLDWDNSAAVHGFTKVEPKFEKGGEIKNVFKSLVKESKNYNTPIDADLINSKSKKGHTLDNIPKNTELLMVDSSLFEKEKTAWAKVSKNKIAYHDRDSGDKYWNKEIDNGAMPPVLLEYDEDNNQLRVRDGNHRLNVYLSKNIEKIPVVLTINAKRFLDKDKFESGGEIGLLTKMVGENPKVEDTPFTWNEEQFIYSDTKYDVKNISDIIYETSFRKAYFGGSTNAVLNVKYQYAIVKDEEYNRWLLLSRIVSDDGKIIMDYSEVGEYDFENLGIMLSHRGRGVGKAFVKELIKRNQLRPSIGYSIAGYETIKSAVNDIENENSFIKKDGGELIEDKITFYNFHKGTKADFKEILKAGVPKRKPDFVSDSGSKYWFTSDSVIRQADHWGKLDTCEWFLGGKESEKQTQGICKLADFENSKNSINFIPKITKDEIKHVISGTNKGVNGSNIQSVANYLKGSSYSVSKTEGEKQFQKEEIKHLEKYINDNNFWYKGDYLDKYLTEGAEQKVYLMDEKTVIKVFYTSFYVFWVDYFNSILLHNFFFPQTAYELLGFIKEDGVIFSVSKQNYIKQTHDTDLDAVKKFLSENGFIAKAYNNYYNPELRLKLEDLHDENVLTNNGVLCFIDTIFYLDDKDFYEKGGNIYSSNSNKLLRKEMPNCEVKSNAISDKNDIFDGTIFDKFNKGGMINEYTYIRIKDSNGGIKQTARFLESDPDQFNALLNLTDKATDLGLIVEKITAEQHENFSIFEDEKSISELTDLLNPKTKDNFETGGSIEKQSISDRILKTYSNQPALKNLNMETIIIESPIYELVRVKEPTNMGDEFLLRFIKPLNTEDNRVISKNLFYIKAHYSPTYDAFVLKSALSKKEIEKMLEGSTFHNYDESNDELIEISLDDEFDISPNPKVNIYANKAVYNLVENKGMSLDDALEEIKLGVPDEEEHRETIQKVIDGKITIDEAIVEIAYVHIMESENGKFYRK